MGHDNKCSEEKEELDKAVVACQKKREEYNAILRGFRRYKDEEVVDAENEIEKLKSELALLEQKEREAWAKYYECRDREKI